MAHTHTHRHTNTHTSTHTRTHTAENDNEVKQKAIIFIYCPDAHYGASNIIPADAAVAADSADALPHKPHHCQLPAAPLASSTLPVDWRIPSSCHA